MTRRSILIRQALGRTMAQVRPRQLLRATTLSPLRNVAATLLQSDAWLTVSSTLLSLFHGLWSSRRGRLQLFVTVTFLFSSYPYARYTKRQRRMVRRARQREQENQDRLVAQQLLILQQESYSGTTGPYISRAPSSRLSSTSLSSSSSIRLGSSPTTTTTTTTCLTTVPLTSVFGTTQSIGNGTCAYDFGETLLQTMQAGNGMVALRDALDMALVRFKYAKKVKPLVATLKGKRVLDVGMGAGGPWYGAALLAGGVTYYVGTQPESCPTRPTPTRDPHFHKRPTEWQCRKECNLTSTIITPNNKDNNNHNNKNYNSEEEEIDVNVAQYLEQCSGGSKMYRNFPLTGLQMMAAYPGYMALLPGTLETLASSSSSSSLTSNSSSSSSSSYHLSSITFDYILLKTVTEHVPDLHTMIRSLWQIMEQCSATAQVKMDHHNFYGYSGHHGFPGSAHQAEYHNKTRTEDNHTTTLMQLGNFMELADWGHVWSSSSSSSSSSSQHHQHSTTIASDPTLNRVRPGDFQALVQVYFDCTCQGIPVGPRELDRFFSDASSTSTTSTSTSTTSNNDVPRRRREQLEARGFSRQELLLNHILLDCRRKSIVYEQDVQWINDQLQLYRPPLDGSYIPQPLQCETI